MITLLFVACSGSAPPTEKPAPAEKPPAPEPDRAFTMEFENLEIDEAMFSATEPRVTKFVTVDYERVDLSLMEIYRRGDDGFGDIVIHDTSPLGEDCNNQDFNGLVEAHGHPWLFSHFECTPGAVYLTRLLQDDAGRLTPESNGRVDFSALGGIWNPCAGQISSWGTHIGSEEYEPNARFVPESEEKHGWDYRAWAGHERYLPAGEKLNPYLYGWTPEITIEGAEGKTSVVKHKAPGRFSHEIAYVLPDERTVYLSDDGSGVGWFMFVADKPRDLSAGWLYAAKFEQTNPMPLEGTVTWVNLGHADNGYVDGLIEAGVGFSDLFLYAEPSGTTCPEGYHYVAADYATECLKLAPPSDQVKNPGKAASRLETRRYAAIRGATTEFEKGEGVTFDPVSGEVFLALAKVSGRMLEEQGAPVDHIRAPKNSCGMIIGGRTEGGVKDHKDTLIGSKHVITRMRQVMAGRWLDEPDANGNRCLEGGIANPDNITYLPGYDVLMIGEDTSHHRVAALWAYEVKKGVLKRVLVAPPHGEVTGIHWAPDIGGHGYLTVAIQHPWRAETLADTELPEGITAENQKSITAVLGPFPKLD